MAQATMRYGWLTVSMAFVLTLVSAWAQPALPPDAETVLKALPAASRPAVSQAIQRGELHQVNQLLHPPVGEEEELLSTAQTYYLLGVTADNAKKPQQAATWYQKAAQLGSPQAQYVWAQRLISGGAGVQKNPNQAGRWLVKAANANHREAQLATAMAYEQGQYGLAKTPAKAVMYYRKGALNKDPLAQYALAYLYEKGRGVDRDIPMAFHWYTQAADAGLAAAQYKLGMIYLSGKDGITAKDAKEGKAWLEKAANKGYTEAQLQLGLLYEEGDLKDTANPKLTALNWYKKAALKGDPNGQMAVGTFYLMGWGTAANPVEAHRWFRASAEQGNDEARNWLTIIERDMTPNELSQARRAKLPARAI